MSGHSKWSTIKRQKAVEDQKRGKIFSKFASGISLAAREGGGDTETNFKLRLAVERAKKVNMPKENIERAIAKGVGVGGAGALEEVLYEGFTPVSGIAMLIEGVTDKKQRTVAELKNIVEKNGGVIGSPGSAAYLFDLVGQIVIQKGDKSLEDIYELAIQDGVEDIEDGDGHVLLFTPSQNLQKVQSACIESGLVIEDAGLVYRPKVVVRVDEDQRRRLNTFVDKIEDHDDVQNVYINANI